MQYQQCPIAHVIWCNRNKDSPVKYDLFETDDDDVEGEDEDNKLLIGSDDDDVSNYQASKWVSETLFSPLITFAKKSDFQNVSSIRWRSGHLPQSKQKIDNFDPCW